MHSIPINLNKSNIELFLKQSLIINLFSQSIVELNKMKPELSEIIDVLQVLNNPYAKELITN